MYVQQASPTPPQGAQAVPAALVTQFSSMRQAVPQAPQFRRSLLRSAHVPLQSVPAHPHVPPVQLRPPTHSTAPPQHT